MQKNKNLELPLRSIIIYKSKINEFSKGAFTKFKRAFQVVPLCLYQVGPIVIHFCVQHWISTRRRAWMSGALSPFVAAVSMATNALPSQQQVAGSFKLRGWTDISTIPWKSLMEDSLKNHRNYLLFSCDSLFVAVVTIESALAQ